MVSVKKKEKKKESSGKEDRTWNLWNVFKRGTAWYVEGVGVKKGERGARKQRKRLKRVTRRGNILEGTGW